MSEFRETRLPQIDFTPTTWGQMQYRAPTVGSALPWQRGSGDWYRNPYLWGAGLGAGLIGDIWGANTLPDLNLPRFGGRYLAQARKLARPQLQAGLGESARLGAGELASLGANLSAMGITGGPKLEAISGLAQQGQAARNMQLYAQWQKQITDLASQLYQWDMQKRIAEYNAAMQRSGGGIGGALSQVGQTFASALPFLLMA